MEYVKLPKIGLTMKTGTISALKKGVGDSVRKGEIVAEFETDKITGEAESPVDGVVLELFATVGEEIEVLAPIAGIGQPGEKPASAAPAEVKAEAQPEVPEAKTEIKETVPAAKAATGRVLAMPLAKRYAKELGIALEDVEASAPDGIVRKRDVEQALERNTVRATPLAKKVAKETGVDLHDVAGTGPGGRISRDDVLAAAQTKPAQAPATVSAAVPEGGVTRKRMSGMRRTIAQRLAQSKQTIPHVYFKAEVDATAMLALKDALKDAAGKGLAPRVTLNDILLKATAAALKKHPVLTSQIDGDDIVTFDAVNLGMAVSVPGGLVVPVIRDAGALSLGELARQSASLAEKAREGRLAGEEMTGGNFTVSNLGASGIDEFSAIINPPEAGILAVGAVKEKAVVVNSQVVVKPMTTLTLSVDHRVVDGAEAAEFMKTLKAILENISLALI
jgi:pyruvate dehydrogenase E2 component (dihydrolipoamide acetyltransferase)